MFSETKTAKLENVWLKKANSNFFTKRYVFVPKF